MTERNKWNSASILTFAIALSIVVFLLCYLPQKYFLKFGEIVIVLFLFYIPLCMYFWQPSESGKEKLNYWCWFMLFSIAWTFIGIFIGSLRYRVPYFSVLRLKLTTWQKMGYLGILAMGPLFLLLSFLSLIRCALFAAINSIIS